MEKKAARKLPVKPNKELKKFNTVSELNTLRARLSMPSIKFSSGFSFN